MRLHHVAVHATDFDRSLTFYTGGLGCGQPFVWEHLPIVRRAAHIPLPDGGWIEVFDSPNRQGPDGHPAIEHFALAVDDVPAAFQRLVAAGASVIEAPVTRTLYAKPDDIEATMAFVAGPDGEVIELYRNDALA